MHIRKLKHIHFMGIGGSGMSGVSILTKLKGHKVSGCDIAEVTDYISQINKNNIDIFQGHDVSHLRGVDVLVTTPAVLYQSEKHPELRQGRKKKKVMTWQEFLGKYLLKGKKVISVAGTHGKSTTTAMASLMFEGARRDPSVIVGAKIREWGGSCRFGKSNLFIVEADEFYDNFLNYTSETVIVNNIEFDHPDFFESEAQVLDSFAKFIKMLSGEKNLIINQDSLGIKKVFDILPDSFLKTLNIYGYTHTDSPAIEVNNSICARNIKLSKSNTSFRVSSKGIKIKGNFVLGVAGIHNLENALGVIVLGNIYGIDLGVIKKTLKLFKGIGRRMELIGEKGGVKIYDDYAHHPTAVRETLKALKQMSPRKRIFAVVEPHSYSRTNALLKEYKNIFDEAKHVVIGPIFPARDTHDFGISGQSIVDVADHENIKHLDSLKKIVNDIKRRVKKGDVVIVMGAGKSYQWVREILEKI